MGKVIFPRMLVALGEVGIGKLPAFARDIALLWCVSGGHLQSFPGPAAKSSRCAIQHRTDFAMIDIAPDPATGEPGWKARPPTLAMYYGGRTGRFTMATARPGDLAVPVGSDFRLEQGTGKIMKYMLMYWVDESAGVTPEEDAAMMIAVKSWVEQMTERGVRLYGGPLRSAAEASIVRVRDGEMLVCDGPFAETKEQIGGYDVVECATLDAAVRLAGEHPLARTAAIEIRPLWDAPWDH